MIRFRNPASGVVTWDDLVKGPITIANHEIDDLVIVRADGIPTYNFAVVVDDWDMRISHVFRGDEHVNNTPWQINIFNALGAPLPVFAHVPIILGDDGQKLSKRRGAVSVTAYEDDGYLPEAMLNYLARLGWSHGDEEIFTREQMVAWFDGGHLSKSPAQWDPAKLDWVNAHYLRALDAPRLLALATAQLARRGIVAPSSDARAARLRGVQGPLQHRRRARRLAGDDLRRRRAERGRPRAACHRRRPAGAGDPARQARRRCRGTRRRIAAAIKETLAAHGLKMPQLAPAVRVLVCGRAQTPSLDAVLEVFDRATVLRPTGAGLTPGAGGASASLAIISPFGGGDRLSSQKHDRPPFASDFDGGIAQLGERLHGMQEVSGSIPLTSTRWVEAGLREAGTESCSPLRLEA